MIYNVCMQIYVEDVLISSSIINFIQLYELKYFFNIKRSNLFIVISSILGAVISLLYPLINLPDILIIVFKITASFLIVKVAFFKSKKMITINLFFLCITFVYGGLATFFIKSNINPMILIIPFLIFHIFVLKAKDYVIKKLKLQSFELKSDVTINGKTFTSTGFIDTGNLVTYNGHGLIIVSLGFLLKFYPDYNILKGGFPVKIIDTITFDSVGIKGKIYITKIDKIVIYNGENKHIFSDIEVGINTDNFKGHDILFSPLSI